MARGGLLLFLAAVCTLAGCGLQDRGELEVAFIDTPESLFADGIRLSAGAQHVRAATGSGLVTLDARGDVVPALADRWIVTDDGRSFIFRLRDGTWPDGSPLTAESARASLLANLRALEGTSLSLDLAPIEEVRAMAGRVVEIRLSGPMPLLLQLLAQPELALAEGEGGSGPMQLVRSEAGATLLVKPPADRGVPEEDDWQQYVRPVHLHAMVDREAIDRFEDGALDVVLGGRVGALPLADTGPLSRGTVQIDPAIGLFGLQIRRAEGFLARDQEREALALALDRAALIAPFNITGWIPTTRMVAPGLGDDPGLVAERWQDNPMDERRAAAARRVAAWRTENQPDGAIRLTVAIGEEPGHALLLRELTRQYAGIGITIERAARADRADMVLVDSVARFAAQSWFLNQFNCSLRRGLCSEDADFLVDLANGEFDSAARESLLAEAEAELTRANVYIPFGSPLRWSLVRGTVSGFEANSWAFHPLPAMAMLPR